MKSLEAALLVFTATASAGCGPKIDRFDAAPARVCAGTPVTLSWKANTDEIRLEASPPAPLPSAVGREGLLHILVSQPTRFQLTAGTGAQAQLAQRDVNVVAVGGAPDLAFAATVDGTQVHAKLHVDEARWDSHVRIDQLRDDWSGAHHPPRARPITLTHAGKTIVLAADGSPSGEMAGLVVGGDWEATSPAYPDEIANPPTAPAPKQFHLTATVQCAP